LHILSPIFCSLALYFKVNGFTQLAVHYNAIDPAIRSELIDKWLDKITVDS